MLLADTHVHLLAGLDDGPATLDEAAAMARMLVAEGVRFAAALAHQNPEYPANTATALQIAAAALAERLAADGTPLLVCGSGEVMLGPDLLADWHAGKLLSLGGHGRFLLVEMPHGVFLDARGVAAEFGKLGVRLVIAHAERYPELLHEPGTAEALIAAGCLVQVTARELAHPPTAAAERALRDWARRGVIHLLGSDGHNLTYREPRMKAGAEALARMAGRAALDRAGRIWGPAVLQGLPVKVPPPLPKPRSWFAGLFGG